MNRKNLPLILMLTAGAVTCIVMFIQKNTVLEKAAILLVVFVLFYILGSVLVWTLDHFEEQNEKKRQEEGAVIEKETEGAAEEAAEGAEAEESGVSHKPER